MEPLTFGLIVGGIALAKKLRKKKGASDSSGGDMDASTTGGETSLNALVGIPYSYGAGTPATPYGKPAKGIKGGLGLDCSGVAQVALVHLGKLPSTAPDRGAAALATISKRIPWGSQQFGDLAFYGDSDAKIYHVMVVNEDARSDGDSEVLGAAGGTSTTNGDNPAAKVSTRASAKYWNTFRFFGRIG